MQVLYPPKLMEKRYIILVLLYHHNNQRLQYNADIRILCVNNFFGLVIVIKLKEKKLIRLNTNLFK